MFFNGGLLSRGPIMNNFSHLNGLALGGFGVYNHPSFISNRGVDYFAGAKKGSHAGGAPVVINNGNPANDAFVPNQNNVNNEMQGLQLALNSAKDEQGIIGKLIDGAKNLTGIGLSSNKCQRYIDKVATGQMSANEAYSKINQYKSKQRTNVNVLSGIGAGALACFAIGFAPVTGGMSLLVGAGVGAGAKAGIKTLDRATNNIEKDAFDVKKILKDGLSGAVNGVVGTLGMTKYFNKPLNLGTTANEAIKNGALTGVKYGAGAGAIIGASDYAIECGFEADQQFTAEGLISATAKGATMGALTGAIAGGYDAKTAFSKFKGSDFAIGPNGPSPSGGPKSGGSYYGDFSGTPVIDVPYTEVPASGASVSANAGALASNNQPVLGLPEVSSAPIKPTVKPAVKPALDTPPVIELGGPIYQAPQQNPIILPPPNVSGAISQNTPLLALPAPQETAGVISEAAEVISETGAPIIETTGEKIKQGGKKLSQFVKNTAEFIKKKLEH